VTVKLFDLTVACFKDLRLSPILTVLTFSVINEFLLRGYNRSIKDQGQYCFKFYKYVGSYWVIFGTIWTNQKQVDDHLQNLRTPASTRNLLQGRIKVADWAKTHDPVWNVPTSKRARVRK